MDAAQANGVVIRGNTGSPANRVELWTTGGVKAIVDASGNLGLGVVPSATVAFKSIEVGEKGCGLIAGGGGQSYLVANAFYGASAFTYVAAAAASSYRQLAGAHTWYTAPSGTAGDPITFTQQMLLNSSGLAVTGALSSTGGAIKSNQSGVANYFMAQQGGVDKWIWYTSDGVNFKLYDSVAANDRLTVTSTGLAVTGALSATGALTLPTATDHLSSDGKKRFSFQTNDFTILTGGASTGTLVSVRKQDNTPVADFTVTGLNATVIGATTPAAGSFTTLSATGSLNTSPDTNSINSFGRFSSGYAWALIKPDSTSTGLEIRSPAGGTISQFSSTGLAVTGALSASGAIIAGAIGPAYAESVGYAANSNLFTYFLARNINTGASAYAGYALNAYGNSWGIRMGSTAANSNALELVVDALGSPVVKLAVDTAGNLKVPGIYANTTASASNVYVASDGTLQRSTSAAGTGTVTSVATTGPLTGGTITTTGTIGIQVANTSQSGYLTNTDWNTFNNKQPAGSYLTAEADTLATVTARGSTTGTAISLTNTGTSLSASGNLYVYQGISFGDGSRYSAINTTIQGAGAGDKVILFNQSNYDARLLIGTNYDMLFKSQGNSAGLGAYKFYSGVSAALAMTIDGYQNVTVTGALNATTKSFLIPHPTKEGMRLRYGSLEGPENGVYVRGRLKDNNTIELPEYWTKLVDPNSITVSLTSIGKHQDLYVDEIADNKVVIGNQNFFGGKINCFYVVYGERMDVEKLVVEI